MKHLRYLLACTLVLAAATAAAQTAITYQGQLKRSGTPLTGLVDMEFQLFESLTGNDPVGGPVAIGQVPVEEGLFQVELDFGSNVFDAGERFLQITVDGTALTPRQPIMPAPLAIRSLEGDGDTLAGLNCGNEQIPRFDSATGGWICSQDETGGGDVNAGDGLILDGDTLLLDTVFTDGLYWARGGNAGTDPALDYLGTTDDTPFELHVDSRRAMRVEPTDGTGTPANIILGHAINSAAEGIVGATISGGGRVLGTRPNTVIGDYGAIGGGDGNTASLRGTVSGGGNNAAATSATVGGGSDNDAAGGASTISGGISNSALGQWAVVGGGRFNSADADNAVVAGGESNTASGSQAAVVGGGSNVAEGVDSFVGGGISNLASGLRSFVGGGSNNAASGNRGVVGGGSANTASGTQSVVDGGSNNTASGERSFVGSGLHNCAGGNHSWAGGVQAKVRPGSASGEAGSGCDGVPEAGASGDEGTFLWAGHQFEDIVSTGPNQFLVRASGGVWFGTDSSPDIPGDRFINTSTGAHLTSGGTWTDASSRDLKTGFEAIDPGSVLERVIDLPVTRWRYRSSPEEGVHLGPVAEDFHAAFGLGSDDRSISSVDASGVAFAAIQGLNEKLEAENNRLKQRLEDLARRNQELETRLAALEALLLEDRQIAGGVR